MIIDKGASPLIRKQDFAHIVILLTFALVIGIYLILTTVLIAKDGVSYIHYAKDLSANPLEAIRDCSDYAPPEYTPGYPLLILMTHKFVGLFGDFPTISTWIYSAQSVTLLCRLLAIIPLYLIGKLIVGNKLSFWAILILIILPYPAKLGSDALRDWPHMLFLATGFLFLIMAVRHKRWWMFGFVGIITGLGYIIRPMCVQLLVYGVSWLVINIFKRKHEYSLSRARIVGGLALLVIGYAVVAVPYMKIRGEILPTRLQQIMQSFSCGYDSVEIPDQNANVYQAKLVPSDTAKALWKLIDNIGGNLMYFFVPFLFLGIYHLLHKDLCEPPLKFFIIAFILLNIVMVILRYVCTGPDLSKRYALPLTAFTIFFVPVGLKVLGREVDKLLCRTVCKNNSSEKGAQRWFFILLLIGLTICMPKLLRPLRIEKKGYRLAIEWLKDNSAQNDIIVAPDKRIGFYVGHNEKGVSIETSVFLNSNVFSYLAWVKPSGKSIKIIKEGTANDPLFKINTDDTVSLVKHNVIGIGISTGKITSDEWNHVAVTYDAAGNYKFYINGVPAGQGSNMQEFVFGDTLLGERWAGQSGNGKLGNVLIFDKILSGKEIAKFHTAGIKPENKVKILEIGFDAEVKYFVKKLKGPGKSPRAMTEKWRGYLNEKSKKTMVVVYGRI